MPKHLLPVLASVASFISCTAHSQFADSVVAYKPGTGVNTNYINPSSALGEPSRFTPGEFGGPVDPFNPPWQSGQIVSLGTNGSLTVQFNSPILNDPAHPFGLDFLIFGNAGFTITNGNFSGGGITDGSLFGANTGANRVSVSADNLTYYVLNPALAPAVDGLFPTDASGDFRLPVNPSLRGSDFSAHDLAGIRALYANSAGGTGFDISWAQDANRQPVSLSQISFIRVDVVDGKSDIDGFAVVNPGPNAVGSIFREDFASEPLARDWSIFGDVTLFHWDPTNQNLQVTWDSSKPNSYFRRSLGTMVNRHDDFSIAFDLQLDDIAAGVEPNKPSTFQLAIGLQANLDSSRTNFIRTTGLNSPNLFEFDFFPETGFGPTVWPAIWSTNSSLNYNGPSDSTILNLPVGVMMRITMAYTASNSTVVTTITTNSIPMAAVNPVTLSTSFTDFRVDTFAVESYSSDGESPPFAGSLLAHGVIDNIVIITPPVPVVNLRGQFLNGQWQVSFSSRTNWSYVLEATQNFQFWSEVSERVTGNGKELTLQDTNLASLNMRFYRVKSQRLD